MIKELKITSLLKWVWATFITLKGTFFTVLYAKEPCRVNYFEKKLVPLTHYALSQFRPPVKC